MGIGADNEPMQGMGQASGNVRVVREFVNGREKFLEELLKEDLPLFEGSEKK